MELAGLSRSKESAIKVTGFKTEGGPDEAPSRQLAWLEISPHLSAIPRVEQVPNRAEGTPEYWGAEGFDLSKMTFKTMEGQPVAVLPNGKLPPGGTYMGSFPNGRALIVDYPAGLTEKDAPVMFLYPGVSLPGQKPEHIRHDADLVKAMGNAVESSPNAQKFIVVTMLPQEHKVGGASVGHYWSMHGALIPNEITDLSAKTQTGYYDDFYDKAVFDAIPHFTNGDPTHRKYGHMAFSQGCAMVNRIIGDVGESSGLNFSGYLPYAACVAGTVEVPKTRETEPYQHSAPDNSVRASIAPGNASSVTIVDTMGDHLVLPHDKVANQNPGLQSLKDYLLRLPPVVKADLPQLENYLRANAPQLRPYLDAFPPGTVGLLATVDTLNQSPDAMISDFYIQHLLDLKQKNEQIDRHLYSAGNLLKPLKSDQDFTVEWVDPNRNSAQNPLKPLSGDKSLTVKLTAPDKIYAEIANPDHDIRVEYSINGADVVIYRLPFAEHKIPGPGQGGPLLPKDGQPTALRGNETLNAAQVVTDQFERYLSHLSPTPTK